jgi:hypothetical protein
MAKPLVSNVEEARGLVLAGKQPSSSKRLQALIDKVKPRVVAAVLADPQVKRRLAGRRFRVVGGDLIDEKPSGDARKALRLAEVGIYDYDRNALQVAVVDLRSGSVVGVTERLGIQPPLTDEELDEAKEIALATPKLRSLRKVRGVQITSMPSRLSFAESGPARGHRIFALYFWVGGKKPRKVGQVAVDLSTRRALALDPEESGRRE